MLVVLETKLVVDEETLGPPLTEVDKLVLLVVEDNPATILVEIEVAEMLASLAVEDNPVVILVEVAEILLSLVALAMVAGRYWFASFDVYNV